MLQCNMPFFYRIFKSFLADWIRYIIYKGQYKKWVMLTNALKTLIKNPVIENFYGKKKAINFLTTFFIFHKNDVKIFLK